jgi:hypothetical protein
MKRLRDIFNVRCKMPLDARSAIDNLNNIDTAYNGLITFNTTNKNYYGYVNNQYDYLLNLLRHDKVYNVLDYG